MIYVVNSARYSFARHIISDFNHKNAVFLIADECHHYGSQENSKIFDFLEFAAAGKVDYFSLGLSATPYCKNFKETLIPALGKEIYHYDFHDAEEVLSNFSVINIALSLSADEREKYDDDHFFPRLQLLANNSKNDNAPELARHLLALYYRRKEIVHLAEARVKAALELIKSLPSESDRLFHEKDANTSLGHDLEFIFQKDVLEHELYSFYNFNYQLKALGVLNDMHGKKVSPTLIEQAKRQIDMGKFRSEWQLSEAACENLLNEASNAEERNYCICMLLLIRFSAAPQSF